MFFLKNNILLLCFMELKSSAISVRILMTFFFNTLPRFCFPQVAFSCLLVLVFVMHVGDFLQISRELQLSVYIFKNDLKRIKGSPRAWLVPPTFGALKRVIWDLLKSISLDVSSWDGQVLSEETSFLCRVCAWLLVPRNRVIIHDLQSQCSVAK